MSVEQQFKSTDDFFSAIRVSAIRGEKRDYNIDANEYLRLQNVNCEYEFKQKKIPSIATLIAVNHYVRPFNQRPVQLSVSNFLTTQESMITTSIVTAGMRQLSNIDISWIAQSDLSEKFLSFTLEDRQTQQAMIQLYDFIPIGQNQFLNTLKQTKAFLQEGKYVGVYPEGRVGKELRQNHKVFEILIKTIQHSHTEFQILPVSIFYAKGVFQTRFGEVLSPQGKAEHIAKEVMTRIAYQLPINLQGAYRE